MHAHFDIGSGGGGVHFAFAEQLLSFEGAHAAARDQPFNERFRQFSGYAVGPNWSAFSQDEALGLELPC